MAAIRTTQERIGTKSITRITSTRPFYHRISFFNKSYTCLSASSRAQIPPGFWMSGLSMSPKSFLYLCLRTRLEKTISRLCRISWTNLSQTSGACTKTKLFWTYLTILVVNFKRMKFFRSRGAAAPAVSKMQRIQGPRWTRRWEQWACAWTFHPRIASGCLTPPCHKI